jgi:hypothetical protein
MEGELMNEHNPNYIPVEDTRGLYNKFASPARTDGDPEGKHKDCTYFVLDLTHDINARRAMVTYAHSCRQSHPQLARDIDAMLESFARQERR